MFNRSQHEAILSSVACGHFLGRAADSGGDGVVSSYLLTRDGVARDSSVNAFPSLCPAALLRSLRFHEIVHFAANERARTLAAEHRVWHRQRP